MADDTHATSEKVGVTGAAARDNDNNNNNDTSQINHASSVQAGPQTGPSDSAPTQNGDTIANVRPNEAPPAPPPAYQEAIKPGANTTQPQTAVGPGPSGPPLSVTPLSMLGDSPQWIDCPLCKRRTQTIVTKKGSSTQIVVGVVLCLVCVLLACLPCIGHWFEDTEYHCASCRQLIARRPHDGVIQLVAPDPHSQVRSQYAGTGNQPLQGQGQETNGVNSASNKTVPG